MKDFISREKVCDFIAEFINNPYSTQDECEMVEAMIDGIQHMPSVKPQEPKIGHWVEHEIKDTCRWLTCSMCGYEWVNKKVNFCPNCGAKMEREDKE